MTDDRVADNRARADGILSWLWQEVRWAREQHRPIIRVEMAPEHWATLQREFGLSDGTLPVDYVAGPKPKVFGYPLRIVKGKKAPEMIVGVTS